MKKLLASLFGLMVAIGLSSCVSQTPQQLAATTVYAAGYATSNDALNHDATLVPTIMDVATKLPQINSGKLTSHDMGVLSAELGKLNGSIPVLKNLFPADSAKLDRAAAFLSGVIQSNAALNGGRAPTVDQVVATTALTDFCNGLIDGIGFWQGRHSVTP